MQYVGVLKVVTLFFDMEIAHLIKITHYIYNIKIFKRFSAPSEQTYNFY